MVTSVVPLGFGMGRAGRRGGMSLEDWLAGRIRALCDAAVMAYTPLRHAHVGETKIHGDRLLPVEWVMLSRWDHDSGEIEFCVECLDRATEIAAQDESFDSLAAAERYAAEQFSLAPDEWRDGFPTLT